MDNDNVGNALLSILAADDGARSIWVNAFNNLSSLSIWIVNLDMTVGIGKYFLIMKWTPIQETLRHVLDSNGNLLEETLFFGINFYATDKFASEPINPVPLYKGGFSLLNYTDGIFATQQDRFGNETKKYPIFEGYLPHYDSSVDTSSDTILLDQTINNEAVPQQ